MFNIFNMRKSASSKDIIMDFAKAWQTLNTKLIEKHLSSDFIYDSQWVFESLDYKGYIKYIRGKFKTLRRNRNNIDVQIVSVSELEGVISIQQNKGEPVFYVIKKKKGKVVKGDLCMFGLFESYGIFTYIRIEKDRFTPDNNIRETKELVLSYRHRSYT